MASDSRGTNSKGTVGRPFEKGASGNPGGRPKGLVRKIREETRDGEEMVEYMLRVARDEDEATKVRVEAYTWLADRGGNGRAKTMTAHPPEVGRLLRGPGEGSRAAFRKRRARPRGFHADAACRRGELEGSEAGRAPRRPRAPPAPSRPPRDLAATSARQARSSRPTTPEPTVHARDSTLANGRACSDSRAAPRAAPHEHSWHSRHA
jgi:Family of unknown function (DUF5681)